MPLRISLATLAILCGGAHADNTELNDMLEHNAASAGHSRLCNEDPLSEQLKSATMLVLALSGLPAENIQLGSAKFTDLMRKEMAERRKDRGFHCKRHMAVAEERLAQAHKNVRALREAGVPPAPK